MRSIGAVGCLGLTLASAALTGMGATAGRAQTPAPAGPKEAMSTPIRLELNRLEENGDSCRAYLLIDNSTGTAHRSFKIDLFVLDTEGIAAKRVVLELGPVAAKKTVIRLFDIQGVPCAKFGKVLLNDVLGCESATGEKQNCLAMTTTDSKASVPLVK
jgi:hypothetical protein